MSSEIQSVIPMISYEDGFASRDWRVKAHFQCAKASGSQILSEIEECPPGHRFVAKILRGTIGFFLNAIDGAHKNCFTRNADARARRPKWESKSSEKWSSGIIRTGVLAFLLGIAPPVLAGYGSPHWSYLEFVEGTQIGTVRVKIEVDPKASPTRMTKLEIRVDGKRIKIPEKVASFAKDAHLNEVSLWRIGSITCIGECGGPYPVELHIPYGPTVDRSADEQDDQKCKTSELFIYFFEHEVQSASYYECNEAEDGKLIDLYTSGSS